MKRIIKSLIVVTAVIVLVKLSSTTNNQTLNVSNIIKKKDVYTEQVSEDITNDEEWTITTDFENLRIYVIEGSEDSISITHRYFEKRDFEIEIDSDSNTIHMSNHYPRSRDLNIIDIANWFFGNDSIVLEVPEGLLLSELELNTDNGKITVEDVTVTNLLIDQNNGKIEIDDTEVANSVTISTTNGNVNLTNTYSVNGSLEVVTTNGKIKLNNVDFENYDLTTTNGKVLLTDLNTTNQDGAILKVHTTNKGIKLEDVYVSDVSLHTTNGDIDYNNDDTDFNVSLYWYTTHGSKEGNVK